MTGKNTGQFGGPGSSHQDREHPGKNHQPTGKKGGGARAGEDAPPGAPTDRIAAGTVRLHAPMSHLVGPLRPIHIPVR